MTTPPVPSLRDRINRVAYVVINVTDLERSRAFYEAVTPFKVVAGTLAPEQPLRGLGIERGAFDGYLMEDGTGGRPTRIHLVEWKSPRPIGRHYPCFWHVGLAKIAILTPNARTKLAQLKALGIRPTNNRIIRGYVSITDPDGVIISFPGGLNQDLPVGDDPRWFERLTHANPVGGDGRFRVDLAQFHYPPPSPETLTPFAEANHVGIARIGFEVDDIDACHAILRQVQPIGLAPGPIAPPERWDLGAEVGVKRMLCFRDPDGVRLELVEKEQVKPMSGCRQPAEGEPIVIDW